ncbi:AraC family transcriptional regulator [Chryseobacterium nematophagum]|uniref:AraC family transcriptional regulator n=1 Tax=Chryseobacterium nematophagum TaxID=2305228 RepID=A0A3M7TGE3_9FLAO|nr:response regulator transcription factor [Chryseobacterium nematophagum]RNA61987.1 AraC family transcriptional regulator [Chryseobacterium nematophagum]
MFKDTRIRIKTISEFHSLRGLPEPKHPLISIIDFEDMTLFPPTGQQSLIFDFYMISSKRNMDHKYRYGQKDYDFDEGVMFFMSPNQVLHIVREENYKNPSGWMLMIHPDFLWNTSLASSIKKYDFFDYIVNEALFVSKHEELTIQHIIDAIREEYHSNIDQFSQDIIISQLETLLNYSQRFYQRQFITRQKANHQLLERMENVLDNYFERDDLPIQGLPTVQFLSDQLNISPQYLRNVLKVLTGQSPQQHIHEKLIYKAKQKLSTTHLSVSEIAYDLGFEHSQSFSKLFKSKTDISPLEFRKLYL